MQRPIVKTRNLALADKLCKTHLYHHRSFPP